MAQYDFGTMDPYATSGIELADYLNHWRDAVASLHRGPVRPDYIVPGQQWIDDSADPIWSCKLYVDPTIGDATLFQIDMSTGLLILDAAPPSGPAGGDLTGMYPAPTIKADVALTGNPTTTKPLPGDNDTSIPTTSWVHDAVAAGIGSIPAPPVTLPPSGNAGGDLSGTYPNPKIKPAGTDGWQMTTVGGVATWAAPGGSASISVSDTPPASPNANQLWWNSVLGTMFIFYNDGNSSQWVPAAPAATGAMPSGAIMDYAGATAPSGWLLCQGQSVATATYPSLFNAIGYTYGGSGANFNVPDLGGRVTAGKEAVATRLTTGVSGVDGGKLGAIGGNQSMQAHSHTLNGTYYPTTGGNLGSPGSFNWAGYSTDAYGAGNAQNVQPTIIMNKIIKV